MSNIKRELEHWGWNIEQLRRFHEDASTPTDPGRQLVEQHVNVTQALGIKHDNGKLPLHLVPVEAIEEVAKVLAFGADKYEDWNWAKGFKWSRLYSASLRHLYAHMRGEDKDLETGLSHLAHCACNLLFLVYHEQHRVGEDDRHSRPAPNKETDV